MAHQSGSRTDHGNPAAQFFQRPFLLSKMLEDKFEERIKAPYISCI